mgnify:CR=1 FL=1
MLRYRERAPPAHWQTKLTPCRKARRWPLRRARGLLVRIRRRFSGIAGGACSDCSLWRSRARLARISYCLSYIWAQPYDAIVRRRLWRRLPVDVLVVPLAILAATYVLAASSQWVLLTSIAMYAAVWHRGRQSLGIARFYQRQAGGPISPMHKRLFSARFTCLWRQRFLVRPSGAGKYEGEPCYALGIGADFSWGLGLIAAGWIVAYLVWTLRQIAAAAPIERWANAKIQTLHPGERWVVLAHAVAFGSAYVLGATNASFLLVLAVHHEVQYLYFTYAIARWPMAAHKQENPKIGNRQSEIRFAASFALWPLIGLAGAHRFAVGISSNGLRHWEWVDYSVTTGSMVESGQDVQWRADALA